MNEKKDILEEKEEQGATMVEVGLLIVLVAVIGIASLNAIGVNLWDIFADTGYEVGGAAGGEIVGGGPGSGGSGGPGGSGGSWTLR